MNASERFADIVSKLMAREIVKDDQPPASELLIQANFHSPAFVRAKAQKTANCLRFTMLKDFNLDPFTYYEGTRENPETGETVPFKVINGIVPELADCGFSTQRNDYRKKEDRDAKKEGSRSITLYSCYID